MATPSKGTELMEKIYATLPVADVNAQASPAALAEKFGRVAVPGARLDSLAVYGLSRGDNGSPDGTVHVDPRSRKRILQVARSQRRYLTRELLEDCDLFDEPAGGSYQWTGIEVEPTAAERGADAERAASLEHERTKQKTLAAQAHAAREAKQLAWAQLTEGLEQTTARPDPCTRTGDYVDSGHEVSCERLALADGATGWYVSWTGDMDGHYYLVPRHVKQNAEAEKARLQRVYQWWRPENHRPDSYPGPGVPEAELTEDERAEVALRQQAKYRASEETQRRLIDNAIKPGDWKNAHGCDAWEALTALGATIAIEIPDENFRAFARGMADYRLHSREWNSLQLTVTLRATLPPALLNKNGSIKASTRRRLPAPHQNETLNRFIRVRVEYTHDEASKLGEAP